MQQQRTDVWRRRNKRPKSEGTAGGEKKEMRGREEEKKTQRLSAFGSVICSLQTKWAGSALNLPRFAGRAAPSKAPPVAQVFLALLLLLWTSQGYT